MIRALGDLEERLLFSCLRGASDEVGDILEGGGLCWEEFVHAVRGHNVAPLVLKKLEEVGLEYVPGDVVRSLQEVRWVSVTNSLYMSGELIRLHEILRSEGISAIPYKGPVLAQLAYGGLGMRPFGDLDLLVDREEVPLARDLLLSSGYRIESEVEGIPQRTWLDRETELVFARSDGRCVVELHWELTDRCFPLPLDLGAMRGRLQRVTLAGGVVPTLSTEDTLLALCAHGAKHLWQRLLWVCDVAGLVRRSAPDWDMLLEAAGEARGRRMLGLGLLLAHTLLGAELPPKVCRLLAEDDTLHSLAEKVYDNMMGGGDVPDLLRDSSFQPLRLELLDGVADRVRYCLAFVTGYSSEDWRSVRLPEPLIPLYGLLRPMRLAGKYGRRLSRRLGD
ncbi:MAG: nucleotidyltransferase family protein [Rubrobacteraceae bacterium]|nr:nucleotidyltransferase family protein [Rubrobacteraceae bacterium]